jgi:hypothetical protein
MELTLDLFLIGAAGLVLWIMMRFPSSGPRSLTRSCLLVVGAFAVLSATQQLAGAVSRVDGPAVALLLVVLPALTLTLWACACLVRAFVAVLSPFRP